jgi:hypothetical protein
MARLKSQNVRVWAISAALALSLAACSMESDVKNALKEKVAEAEAAKKGSLALYQGGLVLSAGTGSFAFADTFKDESLDASFTIVNNVSGELTLGATPVTISGDGAAAYTVTAQPSSPVAGNGGSSSFTIRFKPGAIASFGATATISSSDQANPSFSFSLAGKGIEWRGIKTVVSGAAYEARVAYSGSNVYVLYFDYPTRKLMLVKSPDKGASWLSPFVVDGTQSYYDASNNLVVDGNVLYLSYYRGDQVYFIQVTDNGATFSSSNGKKVSTIAGYPYGYENSIAVDTQYVYIIYSAGGNPAFTYAAKGSSSFSAPVYIDSALSTDGTGGNRKQSSTFIDSDGYINASYFDDVNKQLKCATFTTATSFPMTVSGILTSTISSAQEPSAASKNLISFYNPTSMLYTLYEHYTYSTPPLLILYHVFNTVTIDSSSADVGQSSTLILEGSVLYSTYYDATNKSLKFAKGTRAAGHNDYAFASSSIASVGGTHFGAHFASDASTGSLYVVYYDSAGSGALKLAKSLDAGVNW